MVLTHYRYLASIFTYPNESLKYVVKKIIVEYREKYPQGVDQIELFYKQLPINDLKLMQELYTRSFDVQALTTLDIGYVLFGDSYKRGEILVHLNNECKRWGINCGVELSDQLSNILLLLSESTDFKFLNEFVNHLLIPAILKMVSNFELKNVKKFEDFYLKQYKTLIDNNLRKYLLYGYALKGLYYILSIDFDIEKKIKYNYSSDFLQSLKKEFEIESIEDEFIGNKTNK